MADQLRTGHAEPARPVRQYGRPLFLDASVMADQHGDLWVVPTIGHAGGASWTQRRPFDGPTANLANPLGLDDAARAALVQGLFRTGELAPVRSRFGGRPEAVRWRGGDDNGSRETLLVADVDPGRRGLANEEDAGDDEGRAQQALEGERLA